MGKDSKVLPWIVAALLACTFLWLEGCSSQSVTGTLDESQMSPSGQFRLRDAGVAPTAVYAALADSRWEELEECLGLHFKPSKFNIDLRPSWWSTGPNQAVGGLYHPFLGIEVIADDVQSWKHEMMHYLLAATEHNSDDSHSRGGLVVYTYDYAGNPVSQGADWLRCTTH